ncbi:MAG: TonB-dependent receptor [Calditrichaeota bacterium]|nr:TonB-dependent receptor [Calditrichota bacterium]
MQRKTIAVLFTLLALVLMFSAIPSLSYAQTTGKIVGTVVDKQTGDPLPGANVQIIGTSLGAATDSHGEFIITNVPVGKYSVRARFIGYNDMVIENVRVNLGLTTTLNFQLLPSVIQTQAVKVVAERPLIEKSATNAVRIVTSDEINNLPVRGVQVVANLQPGMVAQDGQLYIRGGRSDEVGYYLEGASVRDVVTGGSAAMLIPEALEEMQLQLGGYNAQYGGANSGLIQQIMKSGTPNFHVSIHSETDNFTPMNQKRFGTYSYGYSDNVITVSGPIPLLGSKARFFLAGENNFYRDRYRRFWEPFAFYSRYTPLPDGTVMKLVDSGLRGGTPGEELQSIVWDGGNVPSGATSNRYTGNGVLTFDLNKIKLRISGTTTWRRSTTNHLPIMRLFNQSRFPVTDYSNGLYTAKITHVLSPSMFYTLSINYYDQRGKTYDPYLKDNYWLYSDSLENAKYGFTQWDTYTRDPNPYDIYGFPFDRPGHLLTGYSKYKRHYIGGNLDFTKQFKKHEFQFGGEMQYWTLRNWSALSGVTTGGLLSFLRSNPDITKDQARFDKYMRSLSPNNYGYDLYGNETNAGGIFDSPRHPVIGAAYVQDKYEYKDLVINAGLRLDYYNMDEYEPLNYKDPGFNSDNLTLPADQYKKVKPFITGSPRLGFAFPVTDQTVFHLQWGKFVQMPQMSQAYRSSASRVSQMAGGFFYTNPMAFAVHPERTTQYEIGFSQQFAQNASFDATLFYKDIKDQLQTRRVFPAPSSGAQAYDITTNGDFATTKGLEFRLTLRRTHRIMGFINYTFSQAKGTGSYVNQASASLDQATNQITIITPLYFNQTHRGAISFDYRFAKNDGGPILERSGLNVMFTFNSGHPYTLSTGGIGQNDVAQGAILPDADARNRRPLEPIGSSTTPWNFNLDMKLDKTVSIANFDVDFFVYVQNVLNTKNVINVYPRTGNAYSDGFLEDPELSGSVIQSAGGEGYAEMYRAINLGNRQHYMWAGFRGTDLWGTPRQIRFGVMINY